MRILVTGAGGLLGGRLALLLSQRFDVVAGRHTTPGPSPLPDVPLDLTRSASVERAIEGSRPDVVIHSAAFANADRCEEEPSSAEAVNVKGTETLARWCRRLGIRLVTLSTDLVLDGTRSFSGETDLAAPILAYGRTKLLGEEATLAEAPGSAVLRVALVVGRGHGPRGTASEAIAWALREARGLQLFTDQYRTPIDPESIADAIARLLPSSHGGRFHLGGPERLSRYELGLRIARLLDLPVNEIRAVTQAVLPVAAPRPADVSLDTARARRDLGWQPRPLDAAIREGRPAAP